MNEIELTDFLEPTMIICINRTYEERDCHPTADEIYDATRWQWKVSLERASKCKLVLARYKNEIIEAYRVTQWDASANVESPATRPDEVPEDDRKAFVGHVAEAGVRNRFVGHSVHQLLSGNSRSAIRYFCE